MTEKPHVKYWDGEPYIAWHEVPLDEVVEVELAPEERELLWEGLHQWGGPSALTDQLAQAMGFTDREAFFSGADSIRRSLRGGEPLSKRNWQRALIATEIVWASGFYGAAFDWQAVTGWDDERTLQVLRQLQSKFGGLRAPRGPDAWH